MQSFVTCFWPNSSTVLSSGLSGELLCWDLARPGKNGGYEVDVLHRSHNRNIFSLAASGQGLVYSVGQERAMSVYDLTARRLCYSLPSLNGFVYCLAANPVEPGVLAVGAGDSLIRLWNVGSSQLFDINYVRFNQAKIMSLAWHPVRFSKNLKS